ncbi:integrase, partial [Candidatus Gastranaerophilus sp. (ex Termes propinquus)]
VRHLRTCHIDFNNRLILFTDTKNGDDRYVPMTDTIYGELKEFLKVRNIASDYIFQNPSGRLVYLDELHKAACKNVGIEDFTIHDWRHNAGSHLAMSGATERESAEILGHKSLIMVKRYSHLSNKHNAKILSQMNSLIFNAKVH